MTREASGCIADCLVLLGKDLEPFRCRRFEWEEGRVARIDITAPANAPFADGWVLAPGLVNAHTHVGDAFLADAATGMTLEEAFFRPDGYKYRELARTDRAAHVGSMTRYLASMAASGTVAHLDFREQGREGAERLREASERTGVRSVILSQFDRVPFSPSELELNAGVLDEAALDGLAEMLAVSDGFSESTMNDLTDPAWEQVRSATEAAGKLRAIHCLENEGYRETSRRRTGRGDLERALGILKPDFVVHLTVADEGERTLLASRGTATVVNPRANALLGLPLPPVARLLDAGIPLLLGTDNAMLNGPDLLAELDFVYRLVRSQRGPERPVAPREVLRMATTEVGRTALGKEFPGYLAEGLPAHFFAMDFSAPHLRDSREVHASMVTRVRPPDVRQTVRAGVTLYQRP